MTWRRHTQCSPTPAIRAPVVCADGSGGGSSRRDAFTPALHDERFAAAHICLHFGILFSLLNARGVA